MKALGIVLLVILLVVLGFGLSTVIVFFLWNLLLALVFHWSEISWLQAFVASIALSIIGAVFGRSSS